MNTHQLTIFIDGMHCRSCELLLEGALGKLSGVSRVEVSHKKGTAIIHFSGARPSMEAISAAVEDSGYRLGAASKRPFFSHRLRDYGEAAITAGLLFVLYLVLRTVDAFDLSIASSAAPGLATVFLIGLVAGVSTCMALIGGLVLGISARHAEMHPEASAIQKFRPHLFFNMGRLISYAFLGGTIGLIGNVLTLSSTVLGYLTIAIGIVMLILGLKLTELFPRLSGSSFMTLPAGILRAFGLHRETKEYSHTGAFVTGALTFFVPCGFTQAMQLYAISTSSFIAGALVMFLFALGTSPGLLGIGGLTAALKGWGARFFFKFAGFVVIVLAIFNLRGGLVLAGIALPQNRSVAPSESFAEEGVQVVRMEQRAGGYRPNRFTVKQNVPVRWIINSTNSYTCAAFILMRDAGISQPLHPGENIIEFTPTKIGQMRFTCSMGMYSGIFNVVD